MSRVFLTYFDVNYAARGIAMIGSLLRRHWRARVVVLALDDQVGPILADAFPEGVEVAPRTALEAFEPRLAATRASRSVWEFYATHKPVFLEWALSRDRGVFEVVYIDADTFFFSGLGPIYRELGGAAIGLSDHRFAPANAALAAHGLYNAGFVICRRSPETAAALSSWREECLEWCRAKVEPGRFMNQAYLNSWPERFGARALAHPGHNLASWNIGRHHVRGSLRGVRVDGAPLVFFHFSGLHRAEDGVWTVRGGDLEAVRGSAVVRRLYRRYAGRLGTISARLTERFGVSGLGTVRRLDPAQSVLDVATGEIRAAA